MPEPFWSKRVTFGGGGLFLGVSAGSNRGPPGFASGGSPVFAGLPELGHFAIATRGLKKAHGGREGNEASKQASNQPRSRTKEQNQATCNCRPQTSLLHYLHTHTRARTRL